MIETILVRGKSIYQSENKFGNVFEIQFSKETNYSYKAKPIHGANK